jgi:hypothetical protein
MSARRPDRRSSTPQDPPDELVLSALDRALLHGPAGREATSLRTLLEHLALPRRSAAARRVRERLVELEARGWLAGARAHGVPVWSLTAAGRRRLESRPAAAELPEAPQHRDWREARASAAQELPRFRAQLAETLERGQRMLADRGDAVAASDDWLLLGNRLLGDCRRLGSAWHCLYEWPEPDDARADRDEPPQLAGDGDGDGAAARLRALRAGRRNVRLWREDD